MALSTVLYLVDHRDAPSMERFHRLNVAAWVIDVSLQDRLDLLDGVLEIGDLYAKYPGLYSDLHSSYTYNGAAMSEDSGDNWTHSFTVTNYEDSEWTDILQYEFSTYPDIWRWAKFEPDFGDPYALLDTNIPEIETYVNSPYTVYAVFGAIGLVEYNYV